MKRTSLAVLLCWACGPAPNVNVPSNPSAPSGAALPSRPELSATLMGPEHIAFDPKSMGLGGHGATVVVRLQNNGAAPVITARVRFAFTATRDGIAFPCAEHVGGSVRVHEPAQLATGESFEFERDLDCNMPLPGHYLIRTRVLLGDDAAGDDVGVFDVEVQGGARVPRPIASRPGLFAMMSGASATRPLPPDAWARGDYRVVVVVTNAGKDTQKVGEGKLSFQVFKKGSTLPCMGQAEVLAMPDSLASGGVHVVSAPVACAPSEDGDYEIVGTLSVGGSEPIEVGRVSLQVTRDPLLFAPLPL